MTKEFSLTGRCLCGAVRIDAIASNLEVTTCHCDMCRSWSTGPFMEITCQNVAFKGEEHIGIIRSSEWAERGFCKECGSNLFCHLIDNSDYQISAGLLDDQTKLQMSLQVYTDEKPDYYTLANKTKTMTADEVFEAFAPSPS
jgi:hypothetical protein